MTSYNEVFLSHRRWPIFFSTPRQKSTPIFFQLKLSWAVEDQRLLLLLLLLLLLMLPLLLLLLPLLLLLLLPLLLLLLLPLRRDVNVAIISPWKERQVGRTRCRNSFARPSGTDSTKTCRIVKLTCNSLRFYLNTKCIEWILLLKSRFFKEG